MRRHVNRSCSYAGCLESQWYFWWLTQELVFNNFLSPSVNEISILEDTNKKKINTFHHTVLFTETGCISVCFFSSLFLIFVFSSWRDSIAMFSFSLSIFDIWLPTMPSSTAFIRVVLFSLKRIICSRHKPILENFNPFQFSCKKKFVASIWCWSSFSSEKFWKSEIYNIKVKRKTIKYVYFALILYWIFSQMHVKKFIYILFFIKVLINVWNISFRLFNDLLWTIKSVWCRWKVSRSWYDVWF